MDAFPISIADLPLTLVLDECDRSMRDWIVERYSPFAATALSSPRSVRIRTEPGPLYIPLDASDVFVIRSVLRDGQLEFESYYEQGWFDQGTGQGELTVRPGGTPENYLRVLYAWLCLAENALLLHSCGVVRNGFGYVFFGHSGSGKTTVASLSMDHAVLSDDLVIIRQQADRLVVYGVPFRGDLPEAPRANLSAELVGLYNLVKAPEHCVERIPAAVGIARLSSCVPFVMSQPGNARRVIEICTRINNMLPVRELNFRRDPGFWRVIDEQ